MVKLTGRLPNHHVSQVPANHHRDHGHQRNEVQLGDAHINKGITMRRGQSVHLDGHLLKPIRASGRRRGCESHRRQRRGAI